MVESKEIRWDHGNPRIHREKLEDKLVSKIKGQPDNESITRLERKLTKIASSVPTDLGGGKHGHAGIIVPNAKYITFS